MLPRTIGDRGLGRSGWISSTKMQIRAERDLIAAESARNQAEADTIELRSGVAFCFPLLHSGVQAFYESHPKGPQFSVRISPSTVVPFTNSMLRVNLFLSSSGGGLFANVPRPLWVWGVFVCACFNGPQTVRCFSRARNNGTRTGKTISSVAQTCQGKRTKVPVSPSDVQELHGAAFNFQVFQFRLCCKMRGLAT